MPENILDEFDTDREEQENRESEKPTELEDFDVDDFTQFMDGVEKPDIPFDEYIPRSAKEKVQVQEGNRTVTRKKVRINGELYPYFYRGIINELHRGDAPIIFIHGKRRSGKSVALSRIVYDLTEEIETLAGQFNPEEQITYGVKPFLKFHVNNVRRALVLEEAGQNLNSKNWYTNFNRSAYDAFEVLGVMNLLTVLASTDHGDVDNDVTKRDKWKIVCVDYPEFKDGECVKPPVFKVEKYEYKPGSEHKELKDGFPKEVCKFSAEIPPDEVMYRYRKKELEHKYDSIKERIEELQEEEGENKGDSNKLTI